MAIQVLDLKFKLEHTCVLVTTHQKDILKSLQKKTGFAQQTKASIHYCVGDRIIVFGMCEEP